MAEDKTRPTEYINMSDLCWTPLASIRNDASSEMLDTVEVAKPSNTLTVLTATLFGRGYSLLHEYRPSPSLLCRKKDVLEQLQNNLPTKHQTTFICVCSISSIKGRLVLYRNRQDRQHMSYFEGKGLANLIASTFQDTYKKRLLKSRRATTADVTSGKLCDDIIKYLAPTLEPYKGCTIIDINPGACLWSAKLHDYLRPKCHLLMEPEPAYYEPFIEPLLRQSGSTYTYTMLHGIHSKHYWSSYDRIFSDPNLLPYREPLAIGDSALRQIDTSMLVIGNMRRSYGIKASGGHVSQTALLMQHMASAALSNAFFHRNGLVRMLWWLEEDRKFPHLSYESVYTRRPLNIALELACKVHQVAGTRSVVHVPEIKKRAIPRPLPIQQQIQDHVQATTHSDGMVVPEARRLLQLDLPDVQDHLEGLNPLEVDCKTFADLSDMLRKFNDYMPFVEQTLNKNYAGKPKVPFDKSLKDDFSLMKYKKCADICREPAKDLPPLTREKKPAYALDLLLRMLNIEASYCALAEHFPDDQQKEDLHQRILETSKACVLDNDKRRYDPLGVEPGDFFPATKMSLFDLTPKSVDFGVKGIASTAEGTRIAQVVIKMLFLWPNQPVPVVFDHIAVNASKDVIKMVPAITDPRRGGRLDPMNVNVRMLSSDVLIDLIKAFIAWPFRPEIWKLDVAAHSEAAHRRDSEDT
ncbi:hypothetical protein MRB53_038571 [Persea americana]|nr:hypothetical protein MRB53_038571 [Persea americana]